MRTRHPKLAVVTLTALVTIAVMSVSTAVAQDWDAVAIETTQVADGLHMLEGRGGNIGVSSGPDGMFLIDDQFAALTDKIRAAVGNIGKQPIRFVLNTHYHRDHTDGNENMGKAGVTVIAHDNVRRRLSVEEWIQSLEQPDKGLPLVTFNDSVTFHLNGEEIHVFHVEPAHTDGDSMVHFKKSNVIHMGDVYFNGLYPFIDVDGGGSVDGTIAAVERVLKLSDAGTKIIPGHGPLSNRKELAVYRDILRDVRDRIAALVGQGKTLEEVQAARPSAAYDETWGGAFIKPDRLAELIYRSLTE